MPLRNILLLGDAGAGKTTVLQKTMALLSRRRFGGFFVRTLPGGPLPTRRTSPPRGLRERAERHLVVVAGKQRHLSSRPLRSQVGDGARVDPTSLLEEGLQALERALEEAEVVVVDDLQDVAALEPRMREPVDRAFTAAPVVLATARHREDAWVAELAAREDTLVLEIAAENRSVLERALADRLSEILEEGAV